MKTSSLTLHPTPRMVTIALLTIAAIGGWICTPDGHSQAPAAANPALTALIVKIKTQQDAMIANQTKIEAQTALLKENLRQAKIFAARGGSGHR